MPGTLQHGIRLLPLPHSTCQTTLREEAKRIVGGIGGIEGVPEGCGALVKVHQQEGHAHAERGDGHVQPVAHDQIRLAEEVEILGRLHAEVEWLFAEAGNKRRQVFHVLRILGHDIKIGSRGLQGPQDLLKRGLHHLSAEVAFVPPFRQETLRRCADEHPLRLA